MSREAKYLLVTDVALIAVFTLDWWLYLKRERAA